MICKVVGALVTTSCRCKLSRKYGSSTGCTEYACGVGVGEVDPAFSKLINIRGNGSGGCSPGNRSSHSCRPLQEIGRWVSRQQRPIGKLLLRVHTGLKVASFQGSLDYVLGGNPIENAGLLPPEPNIIYHYISGALIDEAFS